MTATDRPADGRRVSLRLLRHPVVGVATVTVASQAISAAGLAAMPLLGLQTSDWYALGLQLGYASLNGVVIGVVFNFSVGRPWATHWRTSRIGAVGVSLALTIGLMAWRWLLPGEGDESVLNLLVLALFGIGGAVLASAGVESVAVACCGRPRLFAGLSIAPNVGLLLGVVGADALPGGRGRTLVPVLTWLGGCTVSHLVASRAGRRRESAPVTAPIGDDREVPGQSRAHLTGLIIGVIASAVVPTLLVVPLAQLGTGVTTIVFLVSRLGTSLVGSGVNALLLTRYNWASKARFVGDRLWPAVAVAAAMLGGADLLGHGPAVAPTVGYALGAASWIVMLAVAAVALREANAARRGRTVLVKSIVDVGLSIAAAVVFIFHPSVSGYLATYTLSQATTVVACVRGPRTAAAGTAVALAAMVSIAWGW